jgi:cytochrome c553
MPSLSIFKTLFLLAAAWLAAPSWGQLSVQRQAVCAACHGATGHSHMQGVPSLAAQPKLFLETQLVLMREGIRDVPSMKGMLDGLTDNELTAIAQYYSEFPLPNPPAEQQTALFEYGQKLSKDMRCAICHLPTFLGRDQIPRLAGQREDFLYSSMMQFKNNQAMGRDSNMAASVQGVSDDDLRALAYYLSRVPAQ